MIVTFAIGNSDDKLPQAVWARFAEDLVDLVRAAEVGGAHTHFVGASSATAPWQNMVCALDLGDGPQAEALRGQLRVELAELCGEYGQDSIAWWESAAAEMIPPAVVQP